MMNTASHSFAGSSFASLLSMSSRRLPDEYNMTNGFQCQRSSSKYMVGLRPVETSIWLELLNEITDPEGQPLLHSSICAENCLKPDRIGPVTSNWWRRHQQASSSFLVIQLPTSRYLRPRSNYVPLMAWRVGRCC